MRPIGAIGAIAGIALLASACSSGGGTEDPGTGSSGEDIVIGIEAPISGFAAADGASAVAGAEMAIAEINANGGVLGRQLKLEVGDDQASAAEGSIVAQDLISSGAVAVVGASYSGPSVTSASVYQRQSVPMVTAYSVHPDVTKTGDMIYRIWPVADVEGEALAEYAIQEMGVSSVGVLNLDNDFGTSLAGAFVESFEANGGKVVAQRAEQVGATDFSASLTTIKAANPDSLFIAAYYSEAAQIAKQARSAGLDVPIFGGGFDSPLFLELAGDAANGVTFISNFTSDSSNAEVGEFIEAYTEKTGNAPDSISASVYDCVLVIADAIERAGSTEGAAIAEAMQATSLTGLTGKIEFTADREVRRALFLNQVDDGEVKVVGQVEIGNS